MSSTQPEAERRTRIVEQLQADNQLLLTEVRLDKNQELNITPQGEGVMVVDLQTLENPNVTINVHETQLLLVLTK